MYLILSGGNPHIKRFLRKVMVGSRPVKICHDLKEIETSIAECLFAAIVVCADDKAVLQEFVELVKRQSAIFRQKKVRGLIVTPIRQAQISGYLGKMNLWIASPNQIDDRTLRLKAERAYILAEKCHDDYSARAAQDSKNAEANRVQFQYRPALEHPWDVWILSDSAEVKRVNQRWLLRFKGPLPKEGFWSKLDESRSGSEEDYWVFNWRVETERHKGEKTDGQWEFFGRKPDFVDPFWVFVGDGPTLQFRFKAKAKSPVFRFAVDPQGKFIVTENSRLALERLTTLLATPPEVDVQAAIAGGNTQPAVQTEVRPPDAGAIKGEKANDFSRVELREGPQAFLYLEEAVAFSSKAFLGFAGQPLPLDGVAETFDEDTRTLSVEINAVPATVSFIQGLKAGAALHVNVGLKRAQVFFAALFGRYDANLRRLDLKVDGPVYRTQRRTNLRLEKPQNSNVVVVIEDDAVRLNSEVKIELVDLSAGGAGFTAAPAKPKFLEVGQKLSGVSILLNGEIHRGQAVVRWVFPDGQDPNKIKFGLQFEGFNEQATQAISLFVIEKNYNYLKTYTFQSASEDTPDGSDEEAA